MTRLVQRQVALGEPLPPVYLKVITSLDDVITSEREKPTKLDTGRARALNTTKHKIRKSVKEYETELQKYKDDPDAFTSAYLATMQPAAVSKPAPTPRKVAIEAPEVDDEDGFTIVGRGGRAGSDIYKTLAAINEARGKKVRAQLLSTFISYLLNFQSRVLTAMKPFEYWNDFIKSRGHRTVEYESS